MKQFYCYLTVFLWVFTQISANAQFNWEFLGPDNLGSKTRALAFLSDGTLLAGSEGGGLWSTSDQGVSWQLVDAYNGNPNITSIAVNGDRIYIGTGATSFTLTPFLAAQGGNFDFSSVAEGFIGYIGIPGGGVYVSLDNGATWSNANATTSGPFGDGTLNYQGSFVAIQKVISQGDRTLIGTRSGLFLSLVPDLSIIIPATGNSPDFFNYTFFDLAFGEGDIVYASTADSVFRSIDGGLTFRTITDPALFDRGRLSFQRTSIAVAPSQPQTVYIAGNRSNGELSGVWRSDDSGESWRRYAPPGSPGFTPLGSSGRDAFTLEVFPDNPDELILAGDAYYTFTVEEGWQPAASHVDPTSSNFLPTLIHDVVFTPQDPSVFYIGTDQQIARSTDRGHSFSIKTKGYEAGMLYSAASLGLVGSEALLASSPIGGTLFNGRHLSGLPSAQGFNDISSVRGGLVRVSYSFPGTIITQDEDGGLIRSLSAGEAFETFYGFPQSPGVTGLTVNVADTLIDRTGPQEEGVGLVDNGGIPRTPWVLDEVIADNLLSSGREGIQSEVEHRIFFCSRRYVWLVENALGDPDGLQPSWNRLTNVLASGNEFLTAITVSGDTNHTVYVGTSLGNLYRLDRPHDLANFDADSSVVQLNAVGSQLPIGRSISALAVDPKNPERLIVTYAGYGGNINAFPAFVWYTPNASTTPSFTPISFTIPKEPVYAAAFVEDPRGGESVLLIGTESGLFSAINIGPAAATFTRELPLGSSVFPVFDIFVQKFTTNFTDENQQDFLLEKDNTVLVATHGRGLWQTSSLIFAREKGPETEEIAPLGERLIQIYPNPAFERLFLDIHLLNDAEVYVKVFDLNGKVVLSQSIGELNKDQTYSFPLELVALTKGMYFCQVIVNRKSDNTSFQKTLKMLLRE